MGILKKIRDKTGTVHDIGDSRVDAYETELSGAEHNVPYSPAVLAKTNAIEEGVSEHVGNTANPHKVTKEQLGLSNVENKSSTQIRSEITKENVTNALGYTPIDESRIGAANGVASLDASGRIPASQIPGGFDNIEEYDNLAGFPATGEEGKIYVAKDTNLTYRWTGSQYVEISPSLALGETATTAYRGDRGKTAYDHSQVSGNSTVHHVHENKELLDTYTQTEADLANAVAKVHEHGNKSVLDGITADKVNSWDSKQGSLTAGKNVTIEGNTVSSDQLFVATYGTTTYAEIKVAYDAGKICICTNRNSVFQLSILTSTYAIFTFANGWADTMYVAACYASDNHWVSGANVFQKKLTFDTEPTVGSTNPVTSGGIRLMKPLSHRFDNETSSRLIVWGKADGAGYCRDMVRKFGLQYGSITDFLFTNSVHKDNTTTVSIKILNGSGVPTTSTKRLKASIFKDSSENSYFALWLDGSVSQPGWASYADYYPDSEEQENTVRHFTIFEPSEYTLDRNLTIKYIPFALPYPSSGVLTSDGTSNSWSSVLPVAKGGTGASNAETARTNLSVPSKEDFESHTGDTTVHITAAERTSWNAKQETLTFDDSPTAGSTNPVKSDGIKSAIDGEATARSDADTELQGNIDAETTARTNADETLQTNIDTVDAKGIVVKEIDGEQVICFE